MGYPSSRSHWRHSPRGGMTIVETVAALALLATAVTIFGQFHWLAARQQRSAEARAAAHQALANWMERCAQLPADGLTEDRLIQLAELEPLRERLPDVEPQATVIAEAGPLPEKRLLLSLRWPTVEGSDLETIQLVAWRFDAPAPEEPQP